ncbi:MAG: FHA domain-containing protein, partial [Deltaproteobacteria bacterium]|nr:FHA domain-containing protein [Deltaproteobacteria bacterium]
MPALIVTRGEKKTGESLPLGAETTIGRQPESTLSLTGTGISREHAKIVQEEGQFYLIDLGSSNGTILNGVLIQPKERTLLKNNDRITIQNYHLKFIAAEAASSAASAAEEEEEVT